MTIPDAIAHPLFDNVRGTKAEKYSGKPISLSFESQNLDKKNSQGSLFGRDKDLSLRKEGMIITI